MTPWVSPRNTTVPYPEIGKSEGRPFRGETDCFVNNFNWPFLGGNESHGDRVQVLGTFGKASEELLCSNEASRFSKHLGSLHRD